MPSIPLHVAPASFPSTPTPLPPLLNTPAGLAILEIQGTLNMPTPAPDEKSSTAVGVIRFPLLDLSDSTTAVDVAATEGAWMKKVHLYVGKTQRLVGEVKKLAKPLAVVKKEDAPGEGLVVVGVVKYKLFFGGRPEFV